MKKTQLTWLMAFMMLVFANFGFTSCGDDDDDDDATSLSESIIGTWKYSSADITMGGETISAEEMGVEIDASSVTIKSDKTYEYDGVKQGTWSLNGTTLTFVNTVDPDESMSGTVVVSGNTMTLTNETTVEGSTLKVVIYFTK